MKSWNEFWAGHSRRNYTAVFHSHLQAVIADETFDLSLRLLALLWRSSWGRNSDWCINADGVLMTQADCARELGSDRRAVNPLFQALVKGNYLRLKGREIHPIDDPMEGEAVFASSSLNGAPFPTIDEDEANSREQEGEDAEEETAPEVEAEGFEGFISQVWSREDPAGFASYQKVAEAYKAWRLQLLERYKAYRQLSERVGQTGNAASPKGSDNSAERVRHSVGKGRTNGAPVLISQQENINIPSSSSFSSVVRAALSEYGNVDDDVLTLLIDGCRKNAPDCTAVEICHFIGEKARLMSRHTRNPVGWLAAAVPKCFAGESFAAYRANGARAAAAERQRLEREEMAAREEEWREGSSEYLQERIDGLLQFIRGNPDAASVPSLKKQVGELRARLTQMRKPAESEPAEKTMKAGNG
jgi:hypothetical protein